MTPREYMRACGVPDSVEVATYEAREGIYRAIASRGVARDGHGLAWSTRQMTFDREGPLLATSSTLAKHDTISDAIAWIARKR